MRETTTRKCEGCNYIIPQDTLRNFRVYCNNCEPLQITDTKRKGGEKIMEKLKERIKIRIDYMIEMGSDPNRIDELKVVQGMIGNIETGEVKENDEL